MINLADEFTDWDGLDRWLEAERVLGATFARQVMAAAKPGDGVDQRLENLDPMMSWAQALSQNLRHFRAVGYDKVALAKLQSNAEDLVKQLHARHGWQQPPTSSPHIQPLD